MTVWMGKGKAEEDEQVGHGHAGQVEVGGGLHVLEALDDEDGHGVARHAHHEDEDADDGDGDQGGGGEQGALVVVVVGGVLVHAFVGLHLGSGPRHGAGGLNHEATLRFPRGRTRRPRGRSRPRPGTRKHKI